MFIEEATQLLTFLVAEILKLPERKESMERNNLCAGNISCISTKKV